jgi:hypothetical protein
MIINELAQWAVLAFMGVFVIGLTRQLGNFLMPKHERIALEVGPEIGKRLPEDLVGDRTRLNELMAERHSDWAAVMLVDQDCDGCESMLARLEQDGRLPGPLVAVSRKSDATHRRRLAELADIVLANADAMKAAKITVTPFVIVVDGDLAVLHKQAGPDVHSVVDRWLADHDRPPLPRATPSPRNNGAAAINVVAIAGKES